MYYYMGDLYTVVSEPKIKGVLSNQYPPVEWSSQGRRQQLSRKMGCLVAHALYSYHTLQYYVCVCVQLSMAIGCMVWWALMSWKGICTTYANSSQPIMNWPLLSLLWSATTCIIHSSLHWKSLIIIYNVQTVYKFCSVSIGLRLYVLWDYGWYI